MSNANAIAARNGLSRRALGYRALINSYPKIGSYVVGAPGTTYRDAAKTTLAVHGDPVRALVSSQAGTPFGDLIAANDTVAPTLSVGGFNGRDCLDFVPGDVLKHVLAGSTPVGDCSFFIVCQVAAWVADGALFYSGETSGYDGTNNQLFCLSSSSGGIPRIVLGGNGGNWHQTSRPVDIPMVIAVRYGTGDQILRIETATTVTTPGASPGPTPPVSPRALKTLILGQHGGPGWTQLNAKIREFHWLPNILSPTAHIEFVAALKGVNGIG